MYIRPVHAELDVPTLQAFIQQHPLGLLTTSIPHPEYASLQTTHIPFVIDIPPPSSTSTPPANNDAQTSTDLGVLRGHIARANPQYKAMAASLTGRSSSTNGSTSTTTGSFVKYLFGSSTAPQAGTSRAEKTINPLELEDEVLILFNLPSHSYLTPKYYTSTKPTTGRVVPTWDYAAVQVYGRLRLHNANTDETSDFLQKQVEDLTEQRERAVNGEHQAWRVDESPVEYVEALKKGIAGVEIKITRIEGRFKLSQESTDGDWEGVVAGFRALGTDDGRVLADLIEARGQGRSIVKEKGADAVKAGGEKPPVA